MSGEHVHVPPTTTAIPSGPPPKPADARSSVEAPRQESLSSAKVSEDSKGNPHPEVKIYEGTTEDEAARIATLALDTFLSMRNRLGATANFS